MADPASSGLSISTVGVEFWGFAFPQTTHLGLCFLIRSAYLILPLEYHCGPTCCKANHNPTDALMVLRRNFLKLSRDRSGELMFVHVKELFYICFYYNIPPGSEVMQEETYSLTFQ